MLHTTFARLKEEGACKESYLKFARHKGGVSKWGKDTPFGLDEVLEVCGIDDALWCLPFTVEPAGKIARLFACDCAERVLPIFEKSSPGDMRPRQAIETSRRFANGLATQAELEAARAAAWAAAWDAADAAAWDAADAARAAAWDAAWDAADAAWVAAWAANSAAARAAADAARAAARDAAWAANSAAYSAANNTEREWQAERLKQYLLAVEIKIGDDLTN